MAKEITVAKSYDILMKAAELQQTKGQDYTSNIETSQFENFERANLIASWFKKDEDKAFAVLIGVKLARLASLLNRDTAPNHESLEDTFVDGTNYFALWGGKRLK